MGCIDMLVKISYHKKEKKIGKKLLVLSELHFHKHSYWTTHPALLLNHAPISSQKWPPSTNTFTHGSDTPQAPWDTDFHEGRGVLLPSTAFQDQHIKEAAEQRQEKGGSDFTSVG